MGNIFYKELGRLLQDVRNEHNMTLNTYAHLLEDSENRLVEILNVANA